MYEHEQRTYIECIFFMFVSHIVNVYLYSSKAKCTLLGIKSELPQFVRTVQTEAVQITAKCSVLFVYPIFLTRRTPSIWFRV